MLGEPNRRVLRSGVVMINWLARGLRRGRDGRGPHRAIRSGVRTRSVRLSVAACQARMRWANTSTMKRHRRNRPSCAVGEVGHPDPVGRRSPELPVEQVRRAVAVLGRHGGADPFTPEYPVPAAARGGHVQNATRWPARRRWWVILRRPYSPSGVPRWPGSHQ